MNNLGEEVARNVNGLWARAREIIDYFGFAEQIERLAKTCQELSSLGGLRPVR